MTKKITPYAVIVLLGFIAYGGTLRVGFLWDDHEMIERTPFIKQISMANVQHAFTNDVFEGKGNAYYRPVQTLSNMADYAVWKLNPFGYHLTNLLLHLLNGCLLFYCLRFLFGAAPAFVAALMFVVHPIVVEQLLIIAGRAEVMSLFFMLVAWAFCLQKKAWGYGAAAVAYALACFSKESGITLILFLVLVGALYPQFRLPRGITAGLALVALAFLAVRQAALEAALPLPDVQTFGLFVLKELPAIAVTYLRILLFPFDLHSHRRMVFADGTAVVGAGVFLALIAAAYIKRSKILWFGLGWFFLGLLVKLPVLSTNALMLDHWAYLSGIGVYVVLAHFLIQMINRRGVQRVTGGVVLVGLVVYWIIVGIWNTRGRNTDLAMYRWALEHPSSSVVRYNLAMIHYQQGNYGEAEEFLRESLRMNPTSRPTMNLQALNLWKLGRSTEAITLLPVELPANPQELPSYVNRGLIIGGKEGMAILDEVLRKYPNYEPAWSVKATLLYNMGDWRGALEANRQILRINPANGEAQSNIKALEAGVRDR